LLVLYSANCRRQSAEESDGGLVPPAIHVDPAPTRRAVNRLRYRRLKNLEALEILKSRFNVNVLELPADVLTELPRLKKETLDEEAARRDLQAGP
jgi:hypothetical protein